MAIVKTTLSLTDQDRQWMNEIIASGEYVSNSEYVRNLIRRDKEQRTESPAEIKLIRAKLIKAEQSGFTNKNRDEILADIKEKARRDGVL
ncbi:antitoxin ParD1/3/4 [Nitrosomonas sp. Nm84]|uniref:type II toxin-antitoxin system ParD family antitoxin n=1 Tax=Nitrosomonas sp. Nm84 TaxID=200124 RepID=UPI000D76E005|nr:type II toxin-antitoxin system ParD family antitoxin [Nitrosomonas sp. Nm84]PXW89100.1 antitoxin ParD1/3/4 [Nitrosomonas sp. Nm84]